MAAFISSTWQGTSTRIPGERLTLPEWMTEKVVREILPKCSSLTQREAKAFLGGKKDELSFMTIVELKTMVIGYLRKSGVER